MLLAVATLAASDYQIKEVKVLPIESYAARKEVSGITIAVDPYTTDDRSFSAFDIRRLNSRGYFPLFVIIKNNTSKFLSIGTRDVVLITSSGQQLYTTPAALVVDDVVKSGMSTKSPKKISKETGSPLSDFTNKEMANRTIDPGAVSSGFLFFYTSTPQSNLFAGSTLYIPKLEEEGSKKSFGPFFISLDPTSVLPETAKPKAP
jgi:hypothetical protein